MSDECQVHQHLAVVLQLDVDADELLRLALQWRQHLLAQARLLRVQLVRALADLLPFVALVFETVDELALAPRHLLVARQDLCAEALVGIRVEEAALRLEELLHSAFVDDGFLGLAVAAVA